MAKHLPAGEAAQPAGDDRHARWALSHITEALRGLKFGQVTVIVQDGAVVQVERTERHRFERRQPSGQG
jgi:hypothetical protein